MAEKTDIMTNKKWLATLPAIQCWMVLDWVMHKYGKCYTDTPSAVVHWLDMPFDREQMRDEFETWSVPIQI